MEVYFIFEEMTKYLSDWYSFIIIKSKMSEITIDQIKAYEKNVKKDYIEIFFMKQNF